MKKLRIVTYVIFLLSNLIASNNMSAQNLSTNKVIIKVVDKEDNLVLVGVNIHVLEIDRYYATDINGELIVVVPKIGYTLNFSYIGYETKKIVLDGTDDKVTVKLKKIFTELEEVVISSERPDHNVTNTDLGKNVLQIESLKELPPLAGEIDVLKSMTLLPGVSTVSEASSGINVRGGGFDQNLILLGGGVLYNPSHLFGFFSSINSEVIDNVSLYKGVIPSKYGGRASSVVDIEYKTGDYEHWKFNVGLGMSASKLSVTGPVIKNKLAISVAGRISYINWLLSMVNNADIRNSNADFYDLNGKIDYKLNDNNYLSYSIYKSQDHYNLASDTVNSWSNFSQVINWKHSFSEKFSINTLIAESQYDFSIVNNTGINNFDLNSKILDRSIKLDLNYVFSERSNINVGVEARKLNIDPGKFELINELGQVEKTVNIETESGIEYAGYFYNQHEIGKKISISYGLRYNIYQFLGSKNVNVYRENFPKSQQNIISSENYGNNEVIKEYHGMAPRIGLRYSINESTSIKVGYNRMNQYIQLVSNTATLSPVNVWKLSDTFISPQLVSQYSIGFFKNFKNNKFETSLEGYYKDIENVVEYKDGAVLLLNNTIETELLQGEGKAYGIEAYVKKKTGKWTGWASYTYSRSLRRVQSAFYETQVNNGNWYPSNYDKPHDLTIVNSYKPRPNLTFSAVFTYSTGRPVTYPTDKFKYFGEDLAYFDSRNESRIPDYHRLDVSVTFKIISNIKLFQGDWTFGVYNLYGRKNAYSVFFDDVQGAPPQAYKLSILNSPIPSLSYNVNF